MAVPSLNFCYGEGLQQSYHQPPAPLLPCSSLPLPQPLFNSNPWTAQCMIPPAAQYYQHPTTSAGYRYQPTPVSRGRGKNWKRQNHNKFRRQDQNDTSNNSKDFHCQTCECSFRTKFDLDGHTSQHKQCIHPGCDFTATTRVLKEHELIHRIPKELMFTSEEEITKWREERRKRYPTSVRVREKLLEEEAKKERGETAKDDIHSYRKRGGADYGNFPAKRGRGGRGRYQKRQFRQDERRNEKLEPPSKSLDDDNHCSLDQQSLDQLASSLAKDTGITQRSSPQKTKTPILRNVPKHKATLLEKLLAPEIRRERNTILQCIRHIVKKNFFGIEQETSTSNSTAQTNHEARDSEEDVLSSEENTSNKQLETSNIESAETEDLLIQLGLV